MSKNAQILVLGVALLALGLFVGRLIGANQAYKKSASMLTRQYFRGVATDLATHRQLREMLQANQKDKLAQRLENLVNAEERALARYSDVPAQEKDPEVVQMIERAKQYKPAP